MDGQKQPDKEKNKTGAPVKLWSHRFTFGYHAVCLCNVCYRVRLFFSLPFCGSQSTFANSFLFMHFFRTLQQRPNYNSNQFQLGPMGKYEGQSDLLQLCGKLCVLQLYVSLAYQSSFLCLLFFPTGTLAIAQFVVNEQKWGGAVCAWKNIARLSKFKGCSKANQAGQAHSTALPYLSTRFSFPVFQQLTTAVVLSAVQNLDIVLSFESQSFFSHII